MERSAWERLIDEGENTTQYRYFCEYRDLPVEKRTLEYVAEKYGRELSYIRRLCALYHWRSRTTKYDDYVDKETRRLGLVKAERIRMASLNLSERMLKLAEDKINGMNVADLNARETREYIKAAVALAEVYKDDDSKQRSYLENEDPTAEVVIYLPEIDNTEGEE